MNWKQQVKIQQVKDAGRQQNYFEVAMCLRDIRAALPFEADQVVELFPLVEELGSHSVFLDNQDNTGPAEALMFFQRAAETLPEIGLKQQATASWSRVMEGFIKMAPHLAADEIATTMFCETAPEIKQQAAVAVDLLLRDGKFQEFAGAERLAKLSQAMFENGFEDKAAHLAQKWRAILEAMKLEDALSTVMNSGVRMDCSSPFETEVLDFVFKNHRRTVRENPSRAREVLEYIDLFAKPGGECSTQARKKLQTMLEQGDKRVAVVRGRCRRVGLDHYEI